MKSKWKQNNLDIVLRRRRCLRQCISSKIDSQSEKKKIPKWIANWVVNFLLNRRITVVLEHRISDVLKINANIFQKSSIFLILFLFFNADLFDKCNNSKYKASAFKFVDDANLLAYGNSTKENCRILEKLHDKCANWARKHGATFAPRKYELIHLTKSSKNFYMSATIKIDAHNINWKSNVKILKIQINTKLKWKTHIKKIKSKITKQTLTLTKISTFIWKATLVRAKIVYSAIIRSAIIYEFIV